MPEPPGGTITFLFTDIEGSTRLWEQYPEQMRSALVRHDELFETAVGGNRGWVVRPRGEGDSRFAVFAGATEAVAAAAALQKALSAEPWQAPVTLRVRAALHTGEADLRDGDYYGSAVNRCARIRSAAHGGQTLVSWSTAYLARDALPEGVQLMDLGAHRLKDLQRPEQLFQLVIPGLPSKFPALYTLNSRPNNLPVQRSLIIGREEEIAAVTALLRRGDVGLVTLTGPGGVGKTRLALQVAAEMIDYFADGVFFVSLTPVTDPDLVVPAIAQALGVKETANETAVETLKNHLQDKQMLLILDNFEGLVAAGAAVAGAVSKAAGVKMLVTSREVLRLYGEYQFPVPPLGLPDSKHLPTLERLSQYEAVRLFIERARAVRPDFMVTNESAPAVAEICSRLDGLPLAIELAAARVSILSPQAILARLESRFKLLTGGARDVPVRQQTLHNAFEWSYDLLDAGEQMLFRRLAVFGSSFSLEAAEAVCKLEVDPQPAGGPVAPLDVDVLDGVMSLANKSLLRQFEVESGESRFGMLGTIREFALEKLSVSGERDALRRQHAVFYISMMEGAVPQELLFSVTAELIHWVTWESENTRIAFDWVVENEEFSLASRALYNLPFGWDLNGSLTAGQKWLQGASQKAEQRSGQPGYTLVHAQLLYLRGYLHFLQGQYSAAREHLEQSAALFRDLGDKLGLALVLHPAGMAAQFQSDYAIARSRIEESAALHRELGIKPGLAVTLFSVGDIAMAQGEDAEARARYEESLATYRQVNDKWGSTFPQVSLGRLAWLHGDYSAAYALVSGSLEIRRAFGANWNEAIVLDSLSEVVRCQGDYPAARALAQEALDIYREIEDRSGIAWSLYNLAMVAHYEKDHERAGDLFREALVLRDEQGNKEGITLCLAGLASLAGALGGGERSARLYGAADLLLDALAARMSPYDRADYEQNRSAARSALGEEKYAVGWDEGHAMSTAQAVAYALAKEERTTAPR